MRRFPRETVIGGGSLRKRSISLLNIQLHIENYNTLMCNIKCLFLAFRHQRIKACAIQMAAR